MKKTIAGNSFYTYVLMLLTFFVLLFFTRNIYSDIQISTDEHEQNTIALEKLEKEHKELTQLRKKFDSDEDVIKEEIAGFSGELSDKDILEYLYSYAQKINEGNGELIIRSISIDGGWKTDVGFQKANIKMDAIFSSESTFFAFLNYVTSGSGKYKFYTTQIDYPMNEVAGKIQISIPLTLYYK